MAKTYPYGNGIVQWVSTDWLQENLDRTDITVIDTQPNIHDYIAEHIPGAVYMNEGLLRVARGGRPGQYVPNEAIEPVFRRLGLHHDVPVVVYTGTGAFKKWGDGLEQTMVAYSLARFGHTNVYVLDGGLDKWKQEDKPLTKKFPDISASTFTVSVQKEFFIEYEEFKTSKDGDNVILLDARPSDVYAGQGPWIKPGHIPGAVNLPWARLMDDANKRLLKPDEQLHKILTARAVTPDKMIICSCGTGREATNEFILFKWYLGFPNVKIYEGSFTEWTSFPENPTVTGPNPR